jgi:hemoglobin-like flavoprotein
MSPEHSAIVQRTWEQVATQADHAAGLFYERLFEIDPTTRSLFQSVDLSEQRRKIISALATVVRGLDRLEELVPSMRALGRRHAGFGVKDEQYESVGNALLWMLEKTLGADWTPVARAAWADAYGLLAQVMREGVTGADESTWAREADLRL